MKWFFKQELAIKPIVIETKSINPVFPGQLGLRNHFINCTQIIIIIIQGLMWLVMSLKKRFGLFNVSPFSKAFSPPGIIFLYGMKLREVKRNRLNIFFH